jgi:hypothetical protein
MREVFRRPPPALVCVVAAALFTPGVASAHGLTILSRQTDGNIEVRVGYGRTAATPAPSARVRVKDTTGKVVAEGVTDETGVWRIPTPPVGEYKVEADDDDHAGSVRLMIGPPAGEEREERAAGVATSPVTRKRPPVWPVVVTFAVVAVVVGYWRYRARKPATTSSPTP